MIGQHTPGPWAWSPSFKFGNTTGDLFGLGGRPIFTSAAWENMWFSAYDKETDAANARLIAAAPALLEVLQEMFCDGPVQIAMAGNPIAIAALEAKARAAITAATQPAPLEEKS